MRYVIIRDDDTNALTPSSCLERLYRPFLDRGLPVNLATIPAVATGTRTPDGKLEGFLTVKEKLPQAAPFPSPAAMEPIRSLIAMAMAAPETVSEKWEASKAVEQEKSFGLGNNRSSVATKAPPQIVVPSHTTTSSRNGHGEAPQAGAAPEKNGNPAAVLAIGQNQALVRYLLANPEYNIVQHGFHHDYLEFDRADPAEISQRLESGTRLLMDAGFPRPQTFVAPYDKLSRSSLEEVARRFQVLSTGWFELKRLPRSWWPRYFCKKVSSAPHWRVGKTLLLTHPGCLLSCFRSYNTMLDGILRHVNEQQLTVLVTHWWEYFRNQQPDEPFINFLHETAEYLAGHPDIKVISFSELVSGRIPLN